MNWDAIGAIGEILGTIGVIASLIFVAFSVNRNTSATQAANENAIYVQHSALINKFIDYPVMASIRVKLRNGTESLSESELVQWQAYQGQMIDVWGMAFSRHEKDMLAEDQWILWDSYFMQVFANAKEGLARSEWNLVKEHYADDFAEHFDAVVYGSLESVENASSERA